MSQENVEIMRAMFALVNERGVQAATDAFGRIPGWADHSRPSRNPRVV
jgi:hypothetical protein